MKILAFSDTHLHKKAIAQIKEKSKDVDILICAGDISIFGQGLREVLKEVDAAIKKPLYIIPGNHEEGAPLEEICKPFKNIQYMHRKAKRIGGFLFFFWGGGGFTQRNPSLEAATEKFKQDKKNEDKVIFITHAPPHNTQLDFLDWAGHVGCKSERKFIQEIKPILHICGHLHENFHKQEVLYKKTLVISPGPAPLLRSKMFLTNLDLLINEKITLFQTPVLTTIFTAITNLISPAKMVVFSIIIIAFLIYKQRKRHAFLFFLAIGGGVALELSLKEIIQRSRPENALIEASSTYSLPSGHATIAMIFFLLLIYLFKDQIKNKITQYIFMGVNILLIISIGFSRIYLNIHWFTDVIAGYLIGVLWLYICIKISKKISIAT